MGIESYVVAEMLLRLEEHNAVLKPQFAEVAAAMHCGDWANALSASGELSRILDVLVTATNSLEDYVVAHDGFGATGDSVLELGLRARSMVLLAQLDVLRQAAVKPETSTRMSAWFGHFNSFDGIDAFIRQSIEEVHRIWRPFATNQPPSQGMTLSEQASVYRTMVQVAHRQMRVLVDNRTLTAFLDKGIAATDIPDVHLACKRIASVLATEFDVTLGRGMRKSPLGTRRNR